FSSARQMIQCDMISTLLQQIPIPFFVFLFYYIIRVEEIIVPVDPPHIFHQIPGVPAAVFDLPVGQIFLPISQSRRIGIHGRFSRRYAFQSKTASTAAIATSTMDSSGSLVVSRCSARPGLLNRLTNRLSLLPARRMIS